MKVPRLAIGTARVGMRDYGICNSNIEISQKETNKILKTAIKNGVEFIDTARCYGNAEEKIANSDLAPFFKINTKIRSLKDLSVSLQTLKLDKIYSCMIHNFDDYLCNPKMFSELLEYRKSGKLKKVGFSLYYPGQLSFLLDNQVDFDIIQVPFNICDTRFKKLISEDFFLTKEVHTRSCYLQGIFFAKKPKVSDVLLEKINMLKEYCLDSNIGVDRLLISFCMSRDFIDRVVLGFESDDQLIKNLNLLSLEDCQIPHELILSMSDIEESLIIPSGW